MTHVTETPGLAIPTIHLNGTSREQLLKDLQKAANRVRDALAAVEQTAPNGRD
jgi:hypothetical protein